MNGSEVASERLAVLFLLSVLVLNPPFLLIFDTPAQIAGIPSLYLYLFVAWAALIALLALATELSKTERPGNSASAAQAPDQTSHDLDEAG